MKTRTIVAWLLSVAIIAAAASALTLYGAVRGPLDGAVAVRQLNGGALDAAAAGAMPDLARKLVKLWSELSLVAVWLSWLALTLRERRRFEISERMLDAMKKGTALLTILMALTLAGCMKPFDKPEFAEIKPNETAYLVAMEGDTQVNQAKFASEAYLESVKVATKRVQITHKPVQVGRTPWNVEYMPTVKLVTVDRTPQTRSWTKDPKTGTSPHDEAIHVESRDSVGFCVGVNCTAAVEEADASKFLYHYAGKGLAEIMDQDVRGWVQSYASKKFGELPLSECQSKKGEIFTTCETDAKAFFKEFGLTVRNLGFSDGMTYENPEIQKQIDQAFTAELQKKLAEQARLAQAVKNMQELEMTSNTLAIQRLENEKELAKAENQAKIAETFQQQAEAQQAMTELEIHKSVAQAWLALAQKWQGGVPSWVMIGGEGKSGGLPMLMNMPVAPPALGPAGSSTPGRSMAAK